MKRILLGSVLGLLGFTELGSANLLEVKKAVEEAHCKKLATEYANDPSSSTVQAIAQLQICLAQTLKATSASVKPRNFDIQPPQPPRPSTNNIGIGLPTKPTLPTAPQSIKIR